MAKIVIAGIANCPFYAVAENIGDYLEANLGDFDLRKLQKLSCEWDEWLEEMRDLHNWSHKHSPLIYRELVNTGGRPILIGGINEFQEYAHEYYNVTCPLSTSQLRLIASENLEWKLRQERRTRGEINPMVVAVLEGGGFLVEQLLASRICSGRDIQINVFGPGEWAEALGEVGFECLRGIHEFASAGDCLSGSDLVLFAGDYHEDVARHYSRCCVEKCKPSTKFVFCGVEGDAQMFAQTFYDANKAHFRWSNILAVSGDADVKLRHKIGRKVSLPTGNVTDLVCFGNPANSFYATAKFCKVLCLGGAIQKFANDYRRTLGELLYDHEWTHALVKAAMEEPGSAGRNVVGHVNKVVGILEQWLCSGDGNICSVGILSQEWFGVPGGIFFCFPVVFSQNGGWSVVEDLALERADLANIYQCVKNNPDLYSLVEPEDKARLERYITETQNREDIPEE